MNYKLKSIPITPFPFEYIEYTLVSDDAIYIDSLEKAKTLAPAMNAHAPDGRVRSKKEIYCKCVAGCIAEKIVINFINDMAKYLRSDVIAHEVNYNKGTDDDQVDIVVESTTKAVKIEVRSSFARVQNDKRRYCEWFSIVGCYTSANKAREIIKDYYITVIFNGDESTIIESILNKVPISLQIAAGCSKEYLERNGTLDTLKNKGAKYLVIKPLVNGVPISTLTKNIIESL